MINELLVNLISDVLGDGKRTSKGNVAYVCPFHISNPPGKKNFEINFTENKKGEHKWHCWACNARGKTLYSLFKQLKVSPEKYSLLKQYSTNIEITQENNITDYILSLPKEFKTFNNLKTSDIEGKHALHFLKKRNISPYDILKYNIGYCSSGRYANRIIIPSYDSYGNLNYFTARDFTGNAKKKYLNPDVSRDIVGFESHINWDLPIILCEGFFDAIAIKRNAIPLLGKQIQDALKIKIILSNTNKIYLALDKDAIKDELDFAEMFINEGREVYLVELDSKDPSEIGFQKFTELIQTSTPLTSFGLIEKKLELI